MFKEIATREVNLSRILLPWSILSISFWEQCSRAPPFLHLWYRATFPQCKFPQTAFVRLHLFWTMQEHIGTYGILMDHTWSWGTMQDHAGPCWTMWVHAGPFGSKFCYVSIWVNFCPTPFLGLGLGVDFSFAWEKITITRTPTKISWKQ